MADASPQYRDIRERAFEFAVRVVKLCKYLEKHVGVSRNVVSQLLDAGTSVGANLEEAKAGQSKADFIHKNAIALKEARESNFWLRLILATETFEPAVENGIVELKDESIELANILGKIIVTTKANR
ncbi:MAG: four helix bundle protein [Pyrinomonadaceae bacterium]